MYADDQSQIQRWCKNPDKLVDVGTMVLCSIRMQWVGVGNQLAKVRAGDLTPLWGWKLDGYKYLRDNKRQLYGAVRDRRAGRITTRALMREFLKVPGLGLPKAGFLVQLTCGEAGCLDMHNLERFNLGRKALIIPKRKEPSAQMQAIDDAIALYLGICEACGGSEFLWDSWCEYLNDQVGTFTSGEDVSRRHWEYLK